MPPRFVYWTILIDDGPTAFRARDRDALLPTLHQLRRTNQNVVLKWFARGRLWESPEDARAAERRPRIPQPHAKHGPRDSLHARERHGLRGRERHTGERQRSEQHNDTRAQFPERRRSRRRGPKGPRRK